MHEDGTKLFSASIDYSEFLLPKTNRVYNFQSRRIDFARRSSHKNKMLMILQFEGVLGEIKKKDMKEDNL